MGASSHEREGMANERDLVPIARTHGRITTSGEHLDPSSSALGRTG